MQMTRRGEDNWSSGHRNARFVSVSFDFHAEKNVQDGQKPGQLMRSTTGINDYEAKIDSIRETFYVQNELHIVFDSMSHELHLENVTIILLNLSFPIFEE